MKISYLVKIGYRVGYRPVSVEADDTEVEDGGRTQEDIQSAVDLAPVVSVPYTSCHP